MIMHNGRGKYIRLRIPKKGLPAHEDPAVREADVSAEYEEAMRTFPVDKGASC